MGLRLFWRLAFLCILLLTVSVTAQTAPSLSQQSQPPARESSSPSTVPKTGTQVEGTNGTYTMRVTTRLVILDAVVLDQTNNVVRGLTRDDFHIEELDEPQTIVNFEETGSQSLKPDLSIESTADLDRLAPRAPVNIILLDEFNTRFEDMAFARYSLKKFLEKQPDNLPTPTMLLAVDLEHFSVLSDYTQSKDKLVSALDHHLTANPWRNQNISWAGPRYATAFLTLRRVAEAVMGHRGHKSMIWIGRGFPDLIWNHLPIDAQTRVDNAVQECVNVLRDARVTLYTIDPAGIRTNIAWGEDPFGGNYDFNRLAHATGGRTLYGRNDVDAEIGSAIQDGSNFYTLTYHPTNVSTDPHKFHKIKVTVNRPGLTVITRQGYYLRYGPGHLDPEKPSHRILTDLVAADNSTMVYDGVPITVEPSATDPDAFTIHIDHRGLVWTYATDTEPRKAEVIIVVSTFDAKGKELSRDAKIVAATAPKDAPATGRLERSMNIPRKLEHNPKAVRARVTVRVTLTGRIGTADFALGQTAPGTTKGN